MRWPSWPRRSTRSWSDSGTASPGCSVSSTAYRRLRNFASLCPPQQTKLLVYLKADPKEVDLVPGFTRDVTGLGRHGTGDLELQLRTERDLHLVPRGEAIAAEPRDGKAVRAGV